MNKEFTNHVCCEKCNECQLFHCPHIGFLCSLAPKKEEPQGWERGFDKWWNAQGDRRRKPELIKSFIRTKKSEWEEKSRKKIIKEFTEGERCLNCGDYKKTDRPDLSDLCHKCYEEG